MKRNKKQYQETMIIQQETYKITRITKTIKKLGHRFIKANKYNYSSAN